MVVAAAAAAGDAAGSTLLSGGARADASCEPSLSHLVWSGALFCCTDPQLEPPQGIGSW